MRKRRNELITYRLRVAGFGKLCVTLLAGVLAGVVMWAMTTVTAKLTQLKFDKTRALLSSEDVATAWAYYAGVAMASVGATAFTVLHPRGCPMARGSGIPELKGYLNGNRQRGLFHWRTFLGRSVGVCLVIVATMPFGREGPSVHIGACVASMSLNLPWRKYLGWQPSPEERRQILQLGSAAGVAGAFNAPIGGLLYVMEEIASTLPPDYVWRAMITAGMAVGVAQVLYSANEGRVDYTSLVISDPNSSTGWDMSEIPLIVVLAVLAGALSALFTVAADFFGSVRRGKVRWVPTKMRAFLASKHGQLIDAVLSAALVASCQILIPLAYSCRAAPGEYDPYDPSTEAASGAAARSLQTVIQIPRTFVPYTCADGEFSEMATLMLQNEEGVVKHLFARDELYSEKLFTAPVVAAFLAYFFVIASVTTGGAFPAGVFIPNMLMGAALGRLFGFLAEWCVLSHTGPHTTASAW
jgi:chloride channel 7